MKVLLFSLVLGLLVASQGEAQTDASQVLGHLNGGPSLGGGLDVYLCEHPFRGLVVWISKSGQLPAIQNCSIHWLFTCYLMSLSSLTSLHWLSYMFSAVVILKEDLKAVGLGLLHLTIELKLSQ